ncbi:MAG: signal peptidase II [Betaproteobacteria bacterium]|nr:signal peptidase II [Betaproteobacteria bacterium]
MLKYIVIAFFILILDLISKQWIFNHLDFGSALVITPFFNIVHFQNTGAAFSFLSEASGWQRYFFIVVSLIAIVIIIRLMRERLKQPLLCLALAFILGGAIGNLCDRSYYGFVIDFIYVHYEAYYWPAFNVADSFISIGVALILYDAFKNKKPLLS